MLTVYQNLLSLLYSELLKDYSVTQASIMGVGGGGGGGMVLAL